MAFQSLLVDDAPFTRADKLLCGLLAAAILNIGVVCLFWRLSILGMEAEAQAFAGLDARVQKLERTRSAELDLIKRFLPPGAQKAIQ